MRFLMALIISLTLMLGPTPSVEAHAPVVHSQSSVDHVKEDRKDPRTRGKGKKKGLHKRDTPANKFASTFALTYGDASPSDSAKPGKCKSKKNCKPAKKYPKKRGGKGGSAQTRTGGSTAGNPTVVRPDLIVECGGKKYNAGQGRVICVTIEKPTVTRVEYRTKTVTEKVLYSLGVIVAAGFAVGLLALFLGFILGWRRSSKAEEKFLDSVLHDTKED